MVVVVDVEAGVEADAVRQILVVVAQLLIEDQNCQEQVIHQLEIYYNVLRKVLK